MSTLYLDLKWRDLIYQVTDPELDNFLKEKRTVYAGFDPSADSLHVGNLLPLLMLKRFQQAGHKVIAVLGGATGMIGDPSGKSSERNLLDKETLDRNLQGIKKVIEKFLVFEGDNPAFLLNNAQWCAQLSYLDFLRDIGKHFTVNWMIAKDSVKARFESRDQGISYTEFSYMLLQAFDFYHLNQHYGCTIQIGGSDQWGNITAGCELIRRIAASQNKKAPEVFGLTFPLLTKSDGNKFGKSEEGNIWLSSNYTSPYKLYQFLLQSSDQDVMKLLKVLSFYSEEECLGFSQALQQNPEARTAQKALAKAVTEIVHGPRLLAQAESASRLFFDHDLSDISEEAIMQIWNDIPHLEKPIGALENGLKLMDVLVETELCASKTMARKEITAGGVYINNQRISDLETDLKNQTLLAKKYLLLRKGKKNYFMLKFS